VEQLTIPAKLLAAAENSSAGIIDPGPPSPSQGSGTGPGAGSGAGTGIGPGTGSGLGPGSGGGTGGGVYHSTRRSGSIRKPSRRLACSGSGPGFGRDNRWPCW
jgi:hypothetical protein